MWGNGNTRGEEWKFDYTLSIADVKGNLSFGRCTSVGVAEAPILAGPSRRLSRFSRPVEPYFSFLRFDTRVESC